VLTVKFREISNEQPNAASQGLGKIDFIRIENFYSSKKILKSVNFTIINFSSIDNSSKMTNKVHSVYVDSIISLLNQSVLSREISPLHRGNCLIQGRAAAQHWRGQPNAGDEAI
jgi:hypothetical protein